MKMLLTRKSDNQHIWVNMEQVKMLEPDADGSSTHVVFGSDLVRIVKETISQIGSHVAHPAPLEVYLGPAVDGVTPILTKTSKHILTLTLKIKLSDGSSSLDNVFVGDPRENGSMTVSVVDDLLTVVVEGTQLLNQPGVESKLLNVKLNKGSITILDAILQ